MAELATEGLSPTVQAVASALGDTPVAAQDLVEAILDRHRSDYAHGAAADFAVEWPDPPRRAQVAAWLDEIRALVSVEAHRELHGRVVVLGAALADPAAGRAVVASGLFQALARELEPAFFLSLTDPGAERLRLIPIAVPIAGQWSSTQVWQDRVEVVALSPSGALAAAGHTDGHVSVLGRKDKASHRAAPSGAGIVTALTFSRGGTRLAAGDASGAVTISGPLAEPVLQRIELRTGTPVSELRFDPPGQRLVATTSDPSVVTIHPAGDSQSVAEPRGTAPFVAISRDGRRVAWIGEEGNVKLGPPDLADPELNWAPFQPELYALAVAPDGSACAAGHESAAVIYSPDRMQPLETAGPVSKLAFNRDGTRLAVATLRGERYVMSTDPGEPAVELPAMPGVTGICFSPDGRWVAMVSEYGLRLEDARTGAPVLHLESSIFTALDISWDRLVAGTDGGGLVSLPIGLEPVVERGIAGFSADDVAIADDLDVPLDIDEDVMAFASLIASTKVAPPLSIGLFGDWGSGKTFFMQRLLRRIERLSLTTRSSGVLQKDAPFHKRIAQIQFNAWHYAEGNLWASLVQHVLEQLELPEEQKSAMEARKRDLVGRIAEEERAVDVSEAKVAELESDVEQLAEDERQLREDAATSEKEAKRLSASDPLAAAGDAAGTARRLLGELGWPAGGQTLEELSSTVAEASDAMRRGALLYGEDAPEQRRLVRGLVAAPLVALAIGVAFVLLDASALLASVAAIATTATGVLALTARLVRIRLDSVRERLDALERSRAQLEAARQRHAEKLSAARHAAADAREQAREARGRRQELQQELAQLRPERLLDDVISNRMKSGAYKRHLGLLELVRSDFEKITDYLDEKARDAEKAETSESEDTGISRIVLYIDDLDRCEPARVVEVLKAVHLLLAMKLFVVVVGVDVRWVSGALEQRHDLLGGRHMATSRDYLEKIFQVPFWIEPMDVGATRSMLRGLADVPSPPRRAPMTLRRAAAPEPRGGNGTGPPAATTGGTAAAAPSGSAPPAPGGGGPAPGTPPPLPEARPEQLVIGELEHGFMDELAPLLGRSPRALKRFVNTYRLFKAREPDYEAFLSEAPDMLAAYRAVLFVLALATGLPMLGAAFVDDVIDGGEGTVREALERVAAGEPVEAARLRAWLESDAGRDWAAVPVARLRDRTVQVARFTFHWQPSGGSAAPVPTPPAA